MKETINIEGIGDIYQAVSWGFERTVGVFGDLKLREHVKVLVPFNGSLKISFIPIFISKISNLCKELCKF